MTVGPSRGTDVLATRLFLDGDCKTPYSANACWGFDDKVNLSQSAEIPRS